jgi:hypothetical protein
MLDFTATTLFCCLKGHLLECKLQEGPLKIQQFLSKNTYASLRAPQQEVQLSRGKIADEWTTIKVLLGISV